MMSVPTCPDSSKHNRAASPSEAAGGTRAGRASSAGRAQSSFPLRGICFRDSPQSHGPWETHRRSLLSRRSQAPPEEKAEVFAWRWAPRAGRCSPRGVLASRSGFSLLRVSPAGVQRTSLPSPLSSISIRRQPVLFSSGPASERGRFGCPVLASVGVQRRPFSCWARVRPHSSFKSSPGPTHSVSVVLSVDDHPRKSKVRVDIGRGRVPREAASGALRWPPLPCVSGGD